MENAEHCVLLRLSHFKKGTEELEEFQRSAVRIFTYKPGFVLLVGFVTLRSRWLSSMIVKLYGVMSSTEWMDQSLGKNGSVRKNSKHQFQNKDKTR